MLPSFCGSVASNKLVLAEVCLTRGKSLYLTRAYATPRKRCKEIITGVTHCSTWQGCCLISKNGQRGPSVAQAHFSQDVMALDPASALQPSSYSGPVSALALRSPTSSSPACKLLAPHSLNTQCSCFHSDLHVLQVRVRLHFADHSEEGTVLTQLTSGSLRMSLSTIAPYPSLPSPLPAQAFTICPRLPQ